LVLVHTLARSLPLCPLPLHDALPIVPGGGTAPGPPCRGGTGHSPDAQAGETVARLLERVDRPVLQAGVEEREAVGVAERQVQVGDREGTRLNSSHVKNTYAVFFLKKK